MTEQLSEKTEKGKTYIYIGDEWVVKREPKKKISNEKAKNDIPITIKIGSRELIGKARPQVFENSKRSGFYLWIPKGQEFFGNGRLFLE